MPQYVRVSYTGAHPTSLEYMTLSSTMFLQWEDVAFELELIGYKLQRI